MTELLSQAASLQISKEMVFFNCNFKVAENTRCHIIGGNHGITSKFMCHICEIYAILIKLVDEVVQPDEQPQPVRSELRLIFRVEDSGESGLSFCFVLVLFLSFVISDQVHSQDN